MDVGADHGAVSATRVQDFAACLRWPDGNLSIALLADAFRVIEFSRIATIAGECEFFSCESSFRLLPLVGCPDYGTRV